MNNFTFSRKNILLERSRIKLDCFYYYFFRSPMALLIMVEKAIIISRMHAFTFLILQFYRIDMHYFYFMGIVIALPVNVEFAVFMTKTAFTNTLLNYS